jgi:hypothetical protein
VPQSKQTTTSGNTHTMGSSMFFSPAKWMAISPQNLLWLPDVAIDSTVNFEPSLFA